MGMKKRQDTKAAPKPTTPTNVTRESNGAGAVKTNKAQAIQQPKSKRATSNLALGRKLLAEKADQKQIIASFTEAYKRKGVTDAEFIAKRAAIYLRIAVKSAM